MNVVRILLMSFGWVTYCKYLSILLMRSSSVWMSSNLWSFANSSMASGGYTLSTKCSCFIIRRSCCTKSVSLTIMGATKGLHMYLRSCIRYARRMYSVLVPVPSLLKICSRLLMTLGKRAQSTGSLMFKRIISSIVRSYTPKDKIPSGLSAKFDSSAKFAT